MTIPEVYLQPILREKVEIAIASLKKRKSAGVNIPAELVQAGGETMIDVLTEICNRIWRTGVWLEALLATMFKYNISANLVCTIEQLNDKATSAVQMIASMGNGSE